MSAANASGCAQRTAELLRSFGRPELAAELERHAARPDVEQPSVVVVGETKRGKSSLVNALLGRPDLSPVDVDVATCVHLVFRFAPVDYARVTLAGAADPFDIDLGELADWAADTGNPGNAKGVTGIEVGLAVELLRGLTLVDTPGVGGLELGHADLTLQALGRADALVFVIDAGAPITQTELTFLSRAAERIDTVTFVLTKIDLFPGWRRIHADNLELLRRHAPRFASAPMMPMSSVNAQRALAFGDRPEALAERRRAGLDGVEAVLRGFVTDRARLLSGANTVRLCLRAIAELRDQARGQLAAAAGDPARERQLEAEQQRLAELVPREAQWRRALDADVSKLVLARDGALRSGLEQLQHDYLAVAKKSKTPAELQALSGQFVSAVDATTRRLAEETTGELLAAVTAVIDVLADDPLLRESVARLSTGAERSGREYGAPDQKRLTGLELFTAVTPVLSIDRLITVVPSALGVGVVATGPIGIGIGVAAIALGSGAAVMLAKERKKIAAQGSFAAWVREYTAAVRDAEQRAFATAMIDTRRDLATALEQAMVRRTAELARDRAQAAAARTATVAQREQAIRAATVTLARVETLNRHAQTVLQDLQRARGGSSPQRDPAPRAAE